MKSDDVDIERDRSRQAPRGRRALAIALTAMSCAACGHTRTSSGLEENPHGVAWSEPRQVASGEARRGPWRMNESDYRWVDDPAADVDSAGEIAVVWADQSRKDVFFQRYGRDGEARLPAPVDVSRSPATFSWLPRVVMSDGGASGRVYVLWQEIIFSGGSHGGEILFARSVDGGRTFAEPVNLSNSMAGDGKGRLDADTWDNGSLDLARGPGGELYAAWTEYEGALWLRRSADDGETFGEPRRIGADIARTPSIRAGGRASAPAARGPSLAVSPRGTVYLAWAAVDGPSADIAVARSDDGGRTFSRLETLSEGGGHSDAPHIAVDRGGTVHLVFAESPAGRGGPYHVRYARLREGAGAFEASRRLSPGPEDARFPEIAADAQGRVYVVWKRFLDPRGRPQGLAFTYSRDGGDRFEPASLIPGISPRGFDGSQQGLLTNKLAVNGAGVIAVANSTFQPNEASHVWLVVGEVASAEP